MPGRRADARLTSAEASRRKVILGPVRDALDARLSFSVLVGADLDTALEPGTGISRRQSGPPTRSFTPDSQRTTVEPSTVSRAARASWLRPTALRCWASRSRLLSSLLPAPAGPSRSPSIHGQRAGCGKSASAMRQGRCGDGRLSPIASRLRPRLSLPLPSAGVRLQGTYDAKRKICPSKTRLRDRCRG
jgi:hypothetical protein